MADSRLTPGLVVLDKGLNLQAPKITAPEGSVLDGLNYEQVDFQGQKRIDGYVRYDGRLGSYIDDYYTIPLDVEFTTGEIYTDVDGNIIGIVVGADEEATYLAVIDYNRLPDGEWGSDVDTVEDHYAKVLAYNDVLRSLTGPLPGPVAGLHWFNDRLYAVAPLTVLTLDGDIPSVGETVEIRSEGGNVGPFTVIAVDGSIVTIGSYDVSAYVGSFLQGEFGEAEITEVSTTSVATFFEARTELQAMAEDADPYAAGWSFIHQGWEVKFENGVSLYGSLPSLNQNLQGLGVQGPTSTSGSNGRPLQLQQAVTINGQGNQVNGWKSSTTPTNYNLNPNDLADSDDVYTYADAYIQWDGTSGAVTAPGYTNSQKIEYPANSTVVITDITP